MSGITFKQTRCAPGSVRLRDSSALVNAEHNMTISAARYVNGVKLGLNSNMLQSSMILSEQQARAVAAELLACADALRGRD